MFVCVCVCGVSLCLIVCISFFQFLPLIFLSFKFPKREDLSLVIIEWRVGFAFSIVGGGSIYVGGGGHVLIACFGGGGAGGSILI